MWKLILFAHQKRSNAKLVEVESNPSESVSGAVLNGLICADLRAEHSAAL
jgi:hypothetical protein